MKPMSLTHLRWQINKKDAAAWNSRVHSFRLPKALYEELVRRTYAQGRRPADVIRTLVSAWLESQR